MKRLIKRALLACLCLALVIVTVLGGLLLVDPKIYTDYIKQHAIRAARDQNILISWGKSGMTPLNFTAYDFQASLPRLLLQLSASRLSLSQRPSSWLRLSPEIIIQADLYGGRAESRLQLGGPLGAMPRSITAAGVQPGKHPYVASFLGITSGSIELSAPEIRGQSVEDLTFIGDIALHNISKPQATTLTPALSGLPLALTIPAITSLSGSAHVDLSAEKLSISGLNLTSSLGDVLGRAVYQRTANGHLSTLNAEFKIDLSEEGLKSAGPFLPLVSQNQLNDRSRSFTIALHGEPKRPQVRFWAR